MKLKNDLQLVNLKGNKAWTDDHLELSSLQVFKQLQDTGCS